MKYFDTKKDSLEEAISKAINEKPEQLKEARYEIKFGPNEYGQDDEDDYIDMLQGELEAKRIRVKVSPGSKNNTLSFDTNVPKAKLKKVIEDDLGYYVNESSEYYSNPNAKDLLEAGGKYLKYSDLLLQKGRLMQQGKNTAMIDKEISKEMKKLGIKEATGDKEKYHKGDHEESVDLEEVNAKVIMDKDQGNRDLQKLLKKHKLKIKTLQKNVNPGYDEVEISGDKRDMEKMMKTTGDDDMYKFNPRTKEFELDESKKLESKTTKDVDETLDKIREANVEKGRNMRSILADIWNMGEGKNVFAKDEGFSSDAQRKAAFASGYKEKGKKGKKEEDEKSSKTATGQKPTKVEIEPEVK